MGMMTRRNVKARIPEEEVRAVKAAPAPVKVQKEEPVKEQEKEVTKEEVDKMTYFSLKSLATKNGIEVEGKKAAKLKEEIIDKLNL